MTHDHVIDATDATLGEVVDAPQERIVLVDFWAPWCGPCKALAPVLDEVARDLADTTSVVKIDVDTNPESVRTHSITSVPTMLLFRGGVAVQRISGAMSRTDLVAAIESARSEQQ